MAKQCPQCSRVSLQPISYKGVTIDKCPECHGVWLDDGEDAFVQEILRSVNQESCKDCSYFQESNKECRLLKIFVSRDFHCSNFLSS
ncbi:MAG: zf-TFIIB domain-containing protein [Leptospiraceae bacterium]|nr:zf-TFIIB domain-containing protein [Leptospiraceae bacterium]